MDKVYLLVKMVHDLDSDYRIAISYDELNDLYELQVLDELDNVLYSVLGRTIETAIHELYDKLNS